MVLAIMTPTQGWKCPGCGRSWAPHVDSCRVCEANLSGPVRGATLTIRDLFTTYYEPWAAKHVPSWKAGYASYFKSILRLLGDRPWPELTHAAADLYVEVRISERTATTDKPVSAGTINHELALLKAMLNWSITRRPQVIPGPNPLDKYPGLPQSSARRFHINEPDFVRILEHAGRLLRQMLIVSFETGMRRDEFRLLEWREVDLVNACVRLPANRVKGKKKGRTIPLTDVALQVFRDVARISSTWVFPNPRGDLISPRPVSKTTLWRWFGDARKASGVKGPNSSEVWVHTLRKSFGTINAMESRISIYHLMQIMGHSSKQVHDEYTQISEEYLGHTRDLLNARRGIKPVELPPPPPAESPLATFVGKGRHKGE